jgi:hypothetical protein
MHCNRISLQTAKLQCLPLRPVFYGISSGIPVSTAFTVSLCRQFLLQQFFHETEEIV